MSHTVNNLPPKGFEFVHKDFGKNPYEGITKDLIESKYDEVNYINFPIINSFSKNS